MAPTECPVCGGRVHQYERIETTHRGDRYRFCSDEHRFEFQRTPENFL
jgi:YHS domain-containing protein